MSKMNNAQAVCVNTVDNRPGKDKTTARLYYRPPPI